MRVLKLRDPRPDTIGVTQPATPTKAKICIILYVYYFVFIGSYCNKIEAKVNMYLILAKVLLLLAMLGSLTAQSISFCASLPSFLASTLSLVPRPRIQFCVLIICGD